MGRTPTKLLALGAVVAAAVAGLAGCSSNDDTATTVLNVYAAASLKKTFTEIEKAYEAEHPDVEVKVTFAGSSALVNQIKQGADADVIATADEATMTALGAEVQTPRIFATNTLVIATAAGNPKQIQNFASLRNRQITTVVCAVEVPCGAATAKVEANTGIDIAPVSEETSVSAVLTKVTTGQADAGLVYVTDAKGAGDQVATVHDPAFAAVVNSYPIATLKATKHAAHAEEFTALVLAATGQKVLADAGFDPPVS